MSYIGYQLQVAAILTVFYIVYILFLKQSSLFAYRRVYLLCSLAFSFMIPFITIPVKSPGLYQYYQLLPEVTVGSSVSPGYSLLDSVYIVLSVITIALFIIFLKQLFSIYRLIKASTVYKERGFHIVKTEDNNAYSFFSYVFIGKHIATDEAEVILAHEKVHAILLHSIDILVIDIILLMQWFNPFVWLFRKEIRENHEFEADRLLLDRGVSPDQYQQLLLNQMFQSHGIRFSSFNYNSFIKNRIKMMTIIPRAGKTRFLLATIMSIMVVSAFAFKLERIESITNVSLRNELNQQKDTLKKVREEAQLVPEKVASFNGGYLDAFNTYVTQNVKYPKEAAKAGIQGKIYLQFVVDVDGQVRDVKVLRGVSPLLDEEAVRVIKSSPVWTPAQDKGVKVKQTFTLPVVFKLG